MTPLAAAAPAPDLGLFFLLVAGVILLPGMDMACVAGSALVGGLRAGAAAVAGILVGGLVHVAVAMTGVAAVLAWWPAAFDAVLVAGAAWMTWVGVQIWRSARAPAPGAAQVEAPVSPAAPDGRSVFRRALLTCLGNPKAYAFSLAVFPAFVHAGQRPWWLQAVLLAGIVAGTQATVYGAVALVSARGRRRLAASPRALRGLARGVAGLLVAGAVATVATGWRSAQAQGLAQAPSSPTGASSSSSSHPTETLPMNASLHPAASDFRDGSHDFDFLLGDWRVVNRKRLGILKGDGRWETFEATNHVHALPGGVGNRDEFVPIGWRPGYVGLTFRLYHAPTGTWSLYWVGPNGAGLDPRTGHLLPPVSGRFSGDTGVFEGDDTWEGRPIRVRFTWRRVDASHASWSQAFSADGGRSWETNWEMAFTRQSGAAGAGCAS